jgi:hypothetical protein
VAQCRLDVWFDMAIVDNVCVLAEKVICFCHVVWNWRAEGADGGDMVDRVCRERCEENGIEGRHGGVEVCCGCYRLLFSILSSPLPSLPVPFPSRHVAVALDPLVLRSFALFGD